MRFHFENIGPITSADLELGGLTLLAGRNNTGKTYVAHTTYGFLRTFPDMLRLRATRGDETFTTALASVNSPPGPSVFFSREGIERSRRKWLDDMAMGFGSIGVAQVFSTARSEFSDATVNVSVEPLPADFERAVYVAPYQFSVKCDQRQVCVTALAAEGAVPLPRRNYLPQMLVAAVFPDRPEPFILSAERFGISLFYKELDFTKSRLVEILQQLGEDKERNRDSPYFVVDRIASRYALPVKDNIDYTRGIPSLRGSTGDLGDEKIEGEIKDLVGGYYRAADDEIRFQSRARNRSFNIPLHLASSSARGLSDMYFYLRHTASRNQLLVIDEPESHLDTANQIALARTLARMVRSGIKVLVTTHSDYLIKEINNLVMLSQLDSGVGRRLGYRADDRLSPEFVRAYVAENGSLTRCTVDQHGVDMPVFDDTIDQINRVASELTARVAASAPGERQDGN